MIQNSNPEVKLALTDPSVARSWVCVGRDSLPFDPTIQCTLLVGRPITGFSLLGNTETKGHLSRVTLLPSGAYLGLFLYLSYF